MEVERARHTMVLDKREAKTLLRMESSVEIQATAKMFVSIQLRWSKCILILLHSKQMCTMNKKRSISLEINPLCKFSLPR